MDSTRRKDGSVFDPDGEKTACRVRVFGYVASLILDLMMIISVFCKGDAGENWV